VRRFEPVLGYNSTMNLDSALALLAADPTAPLDLAELALELARDEYPALDVEGELAELAGWAAELRPRLRGNVRARVALLSRYLFHDLGFQGNQKDYYDPRNSYLNEVLARRTGLPILLSTVAIAVGTRAGLEVVGVGLPGHFVAKVVLGKDEVIFDPFHGGRVLTPRDCATLVEEVAGTPFEATREALAAVPVGLIVQRMLNNLKLVYLRQGDFGRAARVTGRLRQLCPGDRTQSRDLGATLLQAGRPGAAIDHLSAYLDADPTPDDAGDVRKLLDQARAAVARWN
jgi:regulator of sirC expression with transglutaminase-like and TPR domain